MFENLMEKLTGKGTSPEQTTSPVANQPGKCPVCGNVVSMVAENGSPLPSEVGNVVICNFCAAELEIVSKEPLRFELLEEAK